MHKILTFLLAVVMLCLSSCVHRSPARHPAQTARVSDLWRGAASYGAEGERSARVSYARVSPERSVRSERKEARREAVASRSRARRETLYLREVMGRDLQWAAAPARSLETALVYRLPSGGYEPGRFVEEPGTVFASPPAPRSPAPSAPSRSAGSQAVARDSGASGSPSPSPRTEVSRAPEPKSPAPSGTAAKSKAETAAKSSSEMEEKNGGEFDHLPYGVPVSGKSGYVTLPRKDKNLPEIDVRGIPTGTPVEIPDPDVPGATIQFRVP